MYPARVIIATAICLDLAVVISKTWGVTSPDRSTLILAWLVIAVCLFFSCYVTNLILKRGKKTK